MWELHTNEGKHYLTCKPTHEQEVRYLRAKMAQGYKLSEVMFCYCPIHVGHSAKGIVETQENKAKERCPKCKRAMLNGKCNQITGECLDGNLAK